MKHIITALIILFATAIQARGNDTDETTYFPYPTVPDSLSTLQKRTDYLMRHFWDRCNMKNAFSSRPKMRQAFADYISFMPYASADSVHQSINAFIKKIEKRPADLLFIAEEAENQLMGDSAQFISEEVYLPFAKAVATNKKIDRTTKMRYERQVRILSATQPGEIAPDIEYIIPDGRKRHLSADTAEVVILYFNDPTCEDCNMAKLRLSADIKANILIRHHKIRVVAITPDEASDEWKEEVAEYPNNWRVGACPDADDIYDIPTIPTFYILGEGNRILAKNFNIDQVLQLISRL